METPPNPDRVGRRMKILPTAQRHNPLKRPDPDERMAIITLTKPCGFGTVAA
jgi:hypothetical protein